MDGWWQNFIISRSQPVELPFLPAATETPSHGQISFWPPKQLEWWAPTMQLRA